ncbi:FMN-dependent NADH-azoreductase [Pseudomonas sp. JUb52]|nr:FMN-dependent NADH-azoreductase [Pseudomonas sp. JUb52]
MTKIIAPLRPCLSPNPEDINMKLLHIDSSIMGNASVTRELSAAVVAAIQADRPDVRVTYRDLATEEISHLSGPIAAGFRQPSQADVAPEALAQHQLSEALVTEFLASDVLVIGAPMYNFSVPTQLKAWLDRIAQVNRTFKYTDRGPIGLTRDKYIVVVSARGGFYADGSFQDMDFQERYLRAFFAFLGVKDVEFVRAEGTSRGDAVRQAGIESASSSIRAIVASLPAN